MKNKLYYFTILFLIQYSFSQSIRKDYREFTQQEMNDYKSAINILYSNGTMLNLANHHASHFNSIIHTRVLQNASYNGEQFLTWHRFNMLDFESLLKNTNPNFGYLTLPFWNWTTDQNSSAAKFWNNDFLAPSNFPNSGFTRNIGGAPGFLGSVANIDSTLGTTTHFINGTIKNSGVLDFLHRVEYYHDYVHVWVGGSMNSFTSPIDPVFYMHHNFIDNLWQEWEDKNIGNQSANTLTGLTNPIVHYDGAPLSGAVLDSRSIPRPISAGSGRNIDVWFAKNGKVILDGANGLPFIANDTSNAYLYRYTAATSTGSNTLVGDMFVGDVQYDTNNNVALDNKGGFEINSSVICNFKAGKSIVFMSGFVAKNGSSISASIISSPNSARLSNTQIVENVLTEKIKVINIFPNPNNGIFKISLNEVSEGTIEISDLYGFNIYKSEFKNQTEFEMNLQDRPKGIYIVKVFSGEQVFTNKIIKK
jgi:tyrosinase